MTARPELVPTARGAGTDSLDVAERYAEEVDAEGRFPSEAIETLRGAGALACQVPCALGGGGLGLAEVAAMTLRLSSRCASTGMIFAMHQIQVASLVRHTASSAWFERYLARLAREGRLIASATSEANVGGDLRKSIAALEPVETAAGPAFRFEKQATTVSYGAYADDLLTTVRRTAASEPGDQVLVLTHVDEMELTPTGTWNALGMRGTSSPGFLAKAVCRTAQILPAPFGVIAAETMVPVSHLLWAHVWLGIAIAACQKAQNFVRVQARKTPGVIPPAALRFAELSSRLTGFRELVRGATAEFTGMEDRAGLSTAGYLIRINTLKLNASEAVTQICELALRICGFQGYSNQGAFSVGRHLRDAHSAALMIANDRLLATNAALLLLHRESH